MRQHAMLATLTIVSAVVCQPLVVHAETIGAIAFESASEHLPTPTPAPGGPPPIPPPPPPIPSPPPPVQLESPGGYSGRDYTPPDVPVDLFLASDGIVVTMTWAGPVARDVERIEVLRNMGGTTAVRNEPIAVLSRGVQRYTDPYIQTNERYTYRLRVRDQAGNVSLTEERAITVPIPLPPRTEVPSLFVQDPPGTPAIGAPVSDGAPPPPLERQASPSISAPTASASSAPQAQTLAPDVYDPSDRDALLSALAIPRDPDAEARARAVVGEEIRQSRLVLGEQEVVPVEHYLAYGNSPATRRLGFGERLAMLRDAAEAFGWTRGSDIQWDGLDRFARGEPPRTRNLAWERGRIPAALRAWAFLRHAPPNFADPADVLAWNALLYPLRFPRNLAQEQLVLRYFRAHFGRTPASSFDWSLVRVAAHEVLRSPTHSR